MERRRFFPFLAGHFHSLQIILDSFDESSQIDSEVDGAIARDLFQSRPPELDRAHEDPLLPLEIAGGDLDDSLIEFTIAAVIFQPDLLERLMAFEIEPLVELLNPFYEARI